MQTYMTKQKSNLHPFLVRALGFWGFGVLGFGVYNRLEKMVQIWLLHMTKAWVLCKKKKSFLCFLVSCEYAHIYQIGLKTVKNDSLSIS